ncbi:betaine reductase [Syntrophus gentianae]|uniref:Betaine reductase n=1 Tax=Syntrophus gentianae TaxID=43775 RepID=A0A1H7WNG4_9BACT|nr:glycine/sarcosine/betaine reductase complex component C subunit beta [Syntrophus gentianae]SEM23132.1 betaine reductase [Syntrophus gentianae]
MSDPVISACSYILVHVPGFVRYGSKPRREIADHPGSALSAIENHLRSFEEVVAYPPNQVFIGNLAPDALNQIEQPWYRHPLPDASRWGPYGEIFPEETFLGVMKLADDFDLVEIEEKAVPLLKSAMKTHPFWKDADPGKISKGVDPVRIDEKIESSGSLPLYCRGRRVGCISRHHERDENLAAQVLMENLLAKASGTLALKNLLVKANVPAGEIDLILNCSEEAVGDRYNRGGGGLAKAIGELCGCVSATGCDIKAFCVGPLYALLFAFGLVKAGLYRRVAVVGGGSLAKLGMKFQGHVARGMPILEDVLGGIAFLVTENDGKSPIVRLDGIGKHDIGAGSSQQNILESLVLKPLDKMGKKITEVDKYAVELQNPEVTVSGGSGNVPLANYRMIGALAVLRKEISRPEIDRFVLEHGMPGFCPTQGHIPAAVPFLGHAMDAIQRGDLSSAMFIARGSLFLGRMTQLSDGLSFLLEKNPGQTK